MPLSGEPPVDVAVHELGGRGTTLLFSHATGFHGRCYQPVADVLADRFRCVAFDYRGHGDTPLPDGWEVNWRGYSEDTAAVAATLDRPVAGFGHSMGGACLLMVAHDHPDWFDNLILFEPVLIPPDVAGTMPGPSRLSAAARKRRTTFASYDEAYANYASKPPLGEFTPDALRVYVDGGFEPVVEGVRLKCSPEHEATTFEMGVVDRTWELLPEIRVPTVILRGNPNEPGPAVFGQQAADLLPSGRLIELDHLDHFGPMTSPTEIAKLIIDATATPAP